jgi:phage terminase large subunit
MHLGVTSRSNVLRRVEQLIAHHEAAQAAPLVLWALVDEAPERFCARVARVRVNFTGRVLAAVPAGFPVPEGVQAVEFAAKAHAALNPLHRARYVVLRGGRGGTKSWAVARALVLRALVEPIRVLCLREIQRSLKDSSLRLLADQIEMLGLSQYFDVLANSITSHAGATFLFEGLHQNVQRIKSLEGVDVAWIEQAEQISETSWSTLLPTIRKAGSQIVLTLNPDLSDDPSYVRFVTNRPPGTVDATLNYIDNPWATPELLAEAEYLRRVDVDAFEHVWNGACRQHSDAQVFRGKYSVESFEVDSGWLGPYFGADWGFSVDPTKLVKSWIHENTLYISDEAYEVECPLDRLPMLFGTVSGSRDSVIHADNSRPEIVNHMRAHGYSNVTSCAKWDGSIQDGILALRSFEKIVVHPRCVHVAEEMKLYSYRVDRTTGAVLPDVRDQHNHTIDAIRYSLQERIRRPAGQGLLAWYAQQNGATAPTTPEASATARGSDFWRTAERSGAKVESL